MKESHSYRSSKFLIAILFPVPIYVSALSDQLVCLEVISLVSANGKAAKPKQFFYLLKGAILECCSCKV